MSSKPGDTISDWQADASGARGPAKSRMTGMQRQEFDRNLNSRMCAVRPGSQTSGFDAIAAMQNSPQSLREKAAFCRAMLHGMSDGLDPRASDFGRQVAALVRSGTSEVPPSAHNLRPSQTETMAAAVRADLTLILKTDAPSPSGPKIAVAVVHTGKEKS